MFGGVTGAGTDFLVLAFRQSGLATSRPRPSGQGFISDPIDKVTTFFVVYIILGSHGGPDQGTLPAGRVPHRAPGRRRADRLSDRERPIPVDGPQPEPSSDAAGPEPRSIGSIP